MKMKISGLLLWALVLGSAAALRAGTTIVKSGERISDYLSALQPGDTLMVRAGVYSESLSMPTSGEPGRPIVLMAYPGERPVVQSATQILSINKKYWVIDGFVFDHQNASNDAFKITSNAAFVVLRNCEVRNGKRDAFDISGGAGDITIENNVIHDFVWQPGSDAHGVVTNPGAARIHILSNVIYNCGGDCIQLYASNSDPISSYAHEIEIRGNTLYTTLGADSENALDFKGVDGAVVADNEIYGFANKAVVVQKGCSNLTFEGNVVHDSQRAMEFRGEGGKTQKNHNIRKNLIYNISDYYAVKFDGVENVEFVNNTIAFVNATGLRVEGLGVTGGRFQNNLFYQTGKPTIKAAFQVTLGHNGWFGVSAGSMAGSGDVSAADPGFVNVQQFDFHLKANSPAVDAGVDVGLSFTGSAPDLGAYEFGEATTSVQLVEFAAQWRKDAVELVWQTRAETALFGYAVERSRDGKSFQSIGFVRARNTASGANRYSYRDAEPAAGTYYYRLRILEVDGRNYATAPVRILVTVPQGFLLEPPQPNPVRLSELGATQFHFSLQQPEKVEIRIYDILGRLIDRLQPGELPAGRASVLWNVHDRKRGRLSPGLYFFEVQAGSVKRVGRLTVLR